ncbi:aminopeptidase [Heliorestis convoluta]|uniref:M18 family aminopeptidase n=1 Tax=Heliorestis convoluta TaxID=356322 RepID=A0A5Q2N397_9FIRM|nr:aminopeptidase [Heliorestis convoluta]QGG47045.1 M18 family aminopeptidase [Heliorestis convoluta]
MPEKENKKQNKNQLFSKQEPLWDQKDKDERKKIMAFAERYRQFLSQAKTERWTVDYFKQRAKAENYLSFEELGDKGLRPGDRIYFVNRNKAIMLVQIGRRPLSEGLFLVGAHVDAPRLDLKPNPLYEDEMMALFKTHYYGGIKKYQWLATPLALHGVTYLSDGTAKAIVIGEEESDPVFTITDLLPHLAKDQMQKKMLEAVEGEGLNILAGGLPGKKDSDKGQEERVKKAILELLQEKYDMTEEDFLSSEWQAVPAGKARDIGFDRAYIGGYGQDDRVCCFTAAEALFSLKEVERTAVVLLVDKEETGSDSNTGMRSRFFEHAVAEMVYATLPQDELTPPELISRRCLFATRALSADVTVALDPNYEGVLDKRNAARMGYGVSISKYTGSRGKYGTSEANAEFVSEMRRIFQQAGIGWQSGELGKVDQGGGGTIAQFLAVYGMDVLDCGVPLLSMHAPLEIAHKADIYETYKAYQAFLRPLYPRRERISPWEEFSIEKGVGYK